MKKQLLILFMAMLTITGFAQTSGTAQRRTQAKKTVAKPSPKVYICEGGSAYAYHSSSSCSGLNRCTHTISFISRSEAESSYGRRPCKKCY